MRFINKVIPMFSVVPLLSVVIINFIVYNGAPIIARNIPHHVFSVPLDDKIPFIPFFIVFYILAFLQWIIGFIFIARENREFACRYFTAEIISKLICGLIFIFFPTTMDRPDIAGSDIFSRLCSLIFFVDAPVNLFPSIHCLESWVCMRSALEMKKAGTVYKVFSVLMSFAVFASVVFVKQHLLLDIIGGIAVFEIGMIICRLTRADRIFISGKKQLSHD